ncbi:agmatinase [Meinhardsimonia xiamenensis]|jgi:agmatinase|uniref:Agmatinase n=1 Tax=Meinhardsimonia xiamenensis TaxID=990712 RepID=A0A1G9FMA0_9RHOB|nr:agmatinase [Meinhardsimonia xiamenensis]PRX37773.1 agmatinase [Meinhardsimonia xiamenensis]SDK89514.1 agmatinase [Meinhardsimonia xiamenensis]
MALEDARTQVDTALSRDGFRGHSFENTFAGVPSFLRRKLTKDLSGVDIAVTGLPFDQAVTNRPGARFGPRAIREASALQSPDPPYGWAVDPMCDLDVADYGDMAFDYARPDTFAAAAEAHVAGILEAGAAPLCLGGDHSVSLPAIRAVAARHGPLALIQFDAHTDTWADEDSARTDHGTMFYKAVREGLIDPARSVQIGIRTVTPDPLGIRIIDAPEVHARGPGWVAQAVRETVGAGPAYLSFDIDALDPAFAPGTGTPVWGGLASWQAAAILRALAGLAVVAGDVVEVSPPFDTSGATAIAGAHAATEILCLIATWRLGRDR